MMKVEIWIDVSKLIQLSYNIASFHVHSSLLAVLLCFLCFLSFLLFPSACVGHNTLV